MCRRPTILRRLSSGAMQGIAAFFSQDKKKEELVCSPNQKTLNKSDIDHHNSDTNRYTIFVNPKILSGAFLAVAVGVAFYAVGCFVRVFHGLQQQQLYGEISSLTITKRQQQQSCSMSDLLQVLLVQQKLQQGFLKMSPPHIHMSFGYACTCFLVLLASIALLIEWRHRKSRQIIERGRCNLPVINRTPLIKFFGLANRDEESLPLQLLDRILARTLQQDSQYGMYGQILGLSTRVIIISHSTPARVVLSKARFKGPAYDSFEDFQGDGIFAIETGERWKAKRASVVHSLLRELRNKEGMERLEQEANHAVDRFIRNIEKEQQLHGSETPDFDIVPFLQNATTGFIYAFITHDDIDQLCIDPSFSPSPTAFLKTVLHSTTKMRLLINEQATSFWAVLPRWVYRAFSPLFRLEQAYLQPFHKFARIACRNAQPGSPLALLRERPSHNSDSASTNVLDQATPTAVVDEAATLIFAGQDTSAATLSWTVHLLSLHPSIQEKLATEIREKCQHHCCSDGGNDLFTKDFVMNLPYLDAVIKESMRLYPVAPVIFRNLTQDITIPPEGSENAGVSTVLPKGSLAVVSIYAMHRNPKLWHRANDFVPDRWINPKLQDLDEGQRSGAFIPFAYGPRNCVGQDIGRVVLRIFLARIVSKWIIIDKRFDCAIKEENNIPQSQSELRKDVELGFTILPLGGVHLYLQPRPSAIET